MFFTRVDQVQVLLDVVLLLVLDQRYCCFWNVLLLQPKMQQDSMDELESVTMVEDKKDHRSLHNAALLDQMPMMCLRWRLLMVALVDEDAMLEDKAQLCRYLMMLVDFLVPIPYHLIHLDERQKMFFIQLSKFSCYMNKIWIYLCSWILLLLQKIM